MKVRFWGVRGSIATPGPATQIYGGNTSCYEVEAEDGTCIVFDAGTGIRELGMDIAKRNIKEVHLFISHTHWDHIQGFPFFTPAYIPGVKIKVYGPTHFEKSLKKIMDLQMDYAYFPISRQQLNAEIEFIDLKEETVTINDKVSVTTKYGNHPVTCLCYKVQDGEKSVVYSGDFEPYYNVIDPDGTDEDDFDDDFEDEDMDSIVEERNQVHKEFCQCDLLIHDAQYTNEEYPNFRGWGHSPMEWVIDMAKDGVKKIILSHHEPTRDDEAMKTLEEKLQSEFSDLDLRFSREGMEIEF